MKMVNKANDPITKCSALLYKGKDFVALSHNTWDMFSSQLRTLKRYELHGGRFGDRIAVEFSSQPGTIWSYDDWYTNPKYQMTITETTNNMYNTSLYDLMTPKSLWTWERSLAVSMIAKTARDFVELFVQKQSGTYNCQFMAFDEKKMADFNGDLPPQTFFIVEVMPGVAHIMDMTDLVNKQGFWSSFNIPYFRDTYEASGYGDKAKTHGDSFIWAKSPRKLIFDREQAKINSISDFKKLMRYNHFHTDPLMKGDPGFGISSRYDLRTDGNAKCFGAIDCKYRIMGSLPHVSGERLPSEYLPYNGFNFIAGPTAEGDASVFVFSESEVCKDVGFKGGPDRFDYDWSKFL
ncbi:hypothetical protein GEMRC1_013498 [Eukaryota sp. GEM-RC1]